LNKFILKFLIIIVDIVSLIAVFYFTLFIRKNLNAFGLPNFDELILYDFSFVIFVIVGLFYYEKIYNFHFDFWQETLKIIKVFFIAFVVVLSVLALTKTNFAYSRVFIVLYFLLAVLFIPIIKRFSKKFFYCFRFFKRKVLIVGASEQIKLFQEEFEKNWYLGQIYAEFNYDSVIIAPKGMSTEELNTTIIHYLDTTKELYVIPYMQDINFAHSNIMEYSNIRYNTIQIENKLLLKSNTLIKNLFDYFLIVLISPIFFILHLFISLLIKFDSHGVIFFKQQRLGKNNTIFECYKYRTMYENSQDILNAYLKNNPCEIEYYEKYHKYKKDPRITKIGAFLRATSLDELAQIINVYKREMSLVGPRPYMLTESEKLGLNKNFILKVKPGITGLWQVSGRNELTFKERNDLEIWYIKNWSLWADFVILVKTIKVVLLKVGAR
jgi:lipopolysaccharide/colanic/teichoic acid biosynthesis glycosyltransferase